MTKLLVLSTQDLCTTQPVAHNARDQYRVLEASEIKQLHDQNIIDDQGGNGRSGTAIALVTGGCFVVVRSPGNRAALSTPKVQNYVGDNGWLVITGHGDSQKTTTVSGQYNNQLAPQPANIERTVSDYVDSAIAAGVTAGMHLNILLDVCHGARAGSADKEDSFAHQLAQAFAARGIHTVIIGSAAITKRFGLHAIQNDQIIFNDQIGLCPKDIHVFKTDAADLNSNTQTVTTLEFHVTDPMIVSSTGISFSNNAYNTLLMPSSQLQARFNVHTPKEIGEKLAQSLNIPNPTMPADKEVYKLKSLLDISDQAVSDMKHLKNIIENTTTERRTEWLTQFKNHLDHFSNKSAIKKDDVLYKQYKSYLIEMFSADMKKFNSPDDWNNNAGYLVFLKLADAKNMLSNGSINKTSIRHLNDCIEKIGSLFVKNQLPNISRLDELVNLIIEMPKGPNLDKSDMGDISHVNNIDDMIQMLSALKENIMLAKSREQKNLLISKEYYELFKDANIFNTVNNALSLNHTTTNDTRSMDDIFTQHNKFMENSRDFIKTLQILANNRFIGKHEVCWVARIFCSKFLKERMVNVEKLLEIQNMIAENIRLIEPCLHNTKTMLAENSMEEAKNILVRALLNLAEEKGSLDDISEKIRDIFHIFLLSIKQQVETNVPNQSNFSLMMKQLFSNTNVNPKQAAINSLDDTLKKLSPLHTDDKRNIF